MCPDVATLANFVNREWQGSNINITGFDAIDTASKKDIAFYERGDPQVVNKSNAGVIVCHPIEEVDLNAVIFSDEPRIDFMKIVNNFFSSSPNGTFIHPTANIYDSANIGEDCYIGPYSVVTNHAEIGDQCIIKAGTTIGEEGFSYRRDESGTLVKEAHCGGVVIENDVEIGSQCSIDRAMFKTTRIGRGTKIDNLSHVAHQTEIGEDVWISSGVNILGSVVIKNQARLYPGVNVAPHVTIGQNSEVAMGATVLEDVKPNRLVGGVPAEQLDSR